MSLNLSGLHGGIFQKTKLFTVTNFTSGKLGSGTCIFGIEVMGKNYIPSFYTACSKYAFIHNSIVSLFMGIDVE
jgi:hypothetical protein